MSGNRADVIVVGAGIAGLTAADALCNAGLSVIVLEARDRIGGRIFTKIDPECGFPIELGAEFVHGRPPVLLDALKREHLAIREIKGEPWCFEKNVGRLSPCGDFWQHTERILKQMRFSKTSDRSFASFLRSPKMRRFDPQEKAQATNYVEGFNAARAEEVGVNWLVRSMRAEEEIDGDRQFRIVGGYGALVEAVRKRLAAAKVRIDLDTVVSQIRWSRGSVEVAARCSGRGITYHAARALITLPLGVLQAGKKQLGAVQFEPTLPQKQRAMRKLKMGKVLAVRLRFRERFWQGIKPQGSPRSLSKMTFLFSQDQLFPTWWTAFPEKSPLLTAWSASWHAENLIHRPPSFIARKALSTLSNVISMDRRSLVEMLKEPYVHDWQLDPFSRGAYSYVLAGGDGAEELLGRPVQNTLFFAGEATALDGHNGTVHGAMSSTRRAVQELLAAVASTNMKIEDRR